MPQANLNPAVKLAWDISSRSRFCRSTRRSSFRRSSLLRQDHPESTLTADQAIHGKTKLGVQRGTNEHELLETRKVEEKLEYELRFYDSAPLAVEDLLNGRIEAIAMDSAPANDAINKGKPVKIVGTFADDDQFAVAIRKDDAELLKLVNEGYSKLKADPYWKELEAKYLTK